MYVNERYTNLYYKKLILLRLRPRISHFSLLITSKGFCKQCIQMSQERFSQSLAPYYNSFAYCYVVGK